MAWQTPPAGLPWEDLFVSSSERFELPAGLLSRVADQESDYNPEAYNPSSGAAGMMQIVPRWHPGVDPFDPGEAIPYAAKYLRELRDRFGSWSLALAAYNAGPSRVEDYGGVPPFPETLAYVREIMADVFGSSAGRAIAGAAVMLLVVALLAR